MESIADKVREILKIQLGLSSNKIADSKKIVEDLGADSLDRVEIVMALEELFDECIPDEEAEKLRTVKDVVDYLTNKINSDIPVNDPIQVDRIVEIGSQEFTKVICSDLPGAGGACHSYFVLKAKPDLKEVPCAVVNFQNGPVKENGVNGCHQEDLLAIVQDRLESFQAGEYACRENAIALTKIQEAMMWLNKRTADRMNRGVEGTSEK